MEPAVADRYPLGEQGGDRPQLGVVGFEACSVRITMFWSHAHSASVVSGCERSGRQVAAQGDERPDSLDDSEGPRTRQEPVAARQRAPEGESGDEMAITVL